MSCVLQISMGRDFDENYGPINYHISERTSLTILTFPICENVVLVTTNNDARSTSITKKVLEVVGKVAWS